ncbi:hypothetical protein JST97_18945 [bacterium]|nr:hypothetical protein [bacterium]
MRSTRAGLSLAEVLVYQALALVLLYLGSSFLYPSLNLQARGLQQAESLRAAHQSMQLLCSDLRLALQSSLFYDPNQGWLAGRPMGGWTSDGTVLMSDQGWFYDLKGVRRAQLSWQSSFQLPLTWKEGLTLSQCQSCVVNLRWHKLSGSQARLEFSPADPRPRGPFRLSLKVGDLSLQATVNARQLK